MIAIPTRQLWTARRDLFAPRCLRCGKPQRQPSRLRRWANALFAAGQDELDSTGNLKLKSTGETRLDDGTGECCCSRACTGNTCGSDPTTVTISKWSVSQNSATCFTQITDPSPVNIWNRILTRSGTGCSWNYTTNTTLAMERTDGTYIIIDAGGVPQPVILDCPNPFSCPAAAGKMALTITIPNSGTGGGSPFTIIYTRPYSSGVLGVYNFDTLCIPGCTPTSGVDVPASFTVS